MNRLGWLGLLTVLFVLASSVAAAHSGSYEHNTQHLLDRDDKYAGDDIYPRYYGNGYSNNYEYVIYYDDNHYNEYHSDRYGNDFYWDRYDYWNEIYDTDDFDDYESFYWFKKNREYEYERFENWFEDEHPWFDTDNGRWEDYLEDWWEDNWDGYVYQRSGGHADWYESDHYRYNRYDYDCRDYADCNYRENVRVYVDRDYRWDDYRYDNRYHDSNSGRCGYRYDYYDSYCRDQYSRNWCNDGYYARKYNDQVWYVQACGRVLD